MSSHQFETTATIETNTTGLAQQLVDRDARHAYLVFLTGPQIGKAFGLLQDSFVLGRTRSAGLCVPDAGVSREHARIFREDGHFFIEDLGSSNGTFVNHARVDRPVRLREGDKITVGATSILRFTSHEVADDVFQRQLLDSATLDPLTGVSNQRTLFDRLSIELSYGSRHGDPCALLVFEVDEFDRYLDRYGRRQCEAILRHVAAIVQHSLRTEDLIARLVGREFAIVARGLTLGESLKLADRIRALVAATPIKARDEELMLTVCVGATSFPQVSTEHPELMLAAAYQALQVAQQAGHDSAAPADPVRGV